MPYSPYKTVFRDSNPKRLATTSVSIYPIGQRNNVRAVFPPELTVVTMPAGYSIFTVPNIIGDSIIIQAVGASGNSSFIQNENAGGGLVGYNPTTGAYGTYPATAGQKFGCFVGSVGGGGVGGGGVGGGCVGMWTYAATSKYVFVAGGGGGTDSNIHRGGVGCLGNIQKGGDGTGDVGYIGSGGTGVTGGAGGAGSSPGSAGGASTAPPGTAVPSANWASGKGGAGGGKIGRAHV